MLITGQTQQYSQPSQIPGRRLLLRDPFNNMLVTKCTIIFLCIFLIGCSDPDILGEWKREVNPIDKDDSLFMNSGWGDITFNGDSTFAITGDTTTTVVQSVNGWHAGGMIKGRWRIEGGSLLLHTSELPAAFDLRYQILLLTTKRLIILSAFARNDTTKSIKYSRKH